MAWYVARSLNLLREEVNQSAPNRSKRSDGSIGDAAHSSRTSDHNPCSCHQAVCARDITHDPKGGFDSYAFADWLRLRCQSGVEDRVKYVISNSRIASPRNGWVWRSYTGANPHDKHVHVSVEHGTEVFNKTSPWGWWTPPPEPPPPTGGFLMALTDSQQAEVYERVMGSLPGPYSTEQRALDPPPEGRLFTLDNADGAYIVSLLERIVAKLEA
jgi:hypothetical protein